MISDIADNLLEIDTPEDDVELERRRFSRNYRGSGQRRSASRYESSNLNTHQKQKRKKVRAEVVVEALVDKRGRVQDVKIVERYLLGKKPEDRESVDMIGYGLEESAMDAARKWMFRPARDKGQAVSSYYVFSLKVGV